MVWEYCAFPLHIVFINGGSLKVSFTVIDKSLCIEKRTAQHGGPFLLLNVDVIMFPYTFGV